MLTLTIHEIDATKRKYSASIGDELIVPRASCPTQEACQILAQRGVSGPLRVNWPEGTPFIVADIGRAANWKPSTVAKRYAWMAD